MSPADARWIAGALDAWQLAREEALRLPEGAPPPIIVFDQECRYESAADGRWRGEPHDGTIRLRGGEEIPVGVTSFASGEEGGPPYFVMSLPSIWRAAGIIGDDDDASILYGVFLHEFMHTTQVAFLAPVFERMEALGSPEDITDDGLQEKFADDPEYVAAWERERDLLFQAALEPDDARARRFAAEALAAMKARQARWLIGENAMWKVADDLFLTMEGLGQWTAYAWLAHPEGGGLDVAAARERMRGRGRWWSQDAGLGLFLVIDRLLPGWQEKAFADDPKLGIDLLEELVATPPP